MSEKSWHEARLIPTSGITGAPEQERRATSALLAVVGAVREYGRAVLEPLGAPGGQVTCYVEVPFTRGDALLYVDGLIRVGGARTWTALVEVKTSASELVADRIESCLDIAREHGFDAVLTISNEIPRIAGQHPTSIDPRALGTVALHHLTWSQVLATALLQKEFRGVADSDQAWILSELIRYLEHSRSGAMEFADMGEFWTSVRDAAATGTLDIGHPGVTSVVTRFDALLRFASLRLGRQLGTEVVPVTAGDELDDSPQRTRELAAHLCAHGRLSGAIRFSDNVGPLVVSPDLRSGEVTCHIDIDTPREGDSPERVQWLLRQLTGAPGDVRLDCIPAPPSGSGMSALLRTVRAQPGRFVVDSDLEIRTIRVASTAPLGGKRSRGRGSFIDSVLAAIDSFYDSVLGSLSAWSETAPRLRGTAPPPTDPAGRAIPAALVSTAYSSQDGVG
jgi:hypothetical protein